MTLWAEAFFRRPDDDTLPAPPVQLAHLVDLFLELNAWRGYDRQAELPRLLSIETIAAWSSVTGVKLSRFELEVIQKLEGAYWEALANPCVENRQSFFEQMKTLAISEGRVKTVPFNPGKSK